MDLTPILKALVLIGFIQMDAEIYLHLALNGPQPAKSIAQALNIPQRKVSRGISTLEQKAILKPLPGYPVRFQAAPFEEVLDRFEKVSLEGAEQMEQKKQEALRIWRSTILGTENVERD